MNPQRKVCPIVGCSRTMPLYDTIMCEHHWYLVPKPLRDRIWWSYRAGNGGTEEHFSLVLEAITEATLAEPPEVRAMKDPFTTDPLCTRLAEKERRDQAANWRDSKRRWWQGEPDLEKPGPCLECGAEVVARDGFDWCCGECGTPRFVMKT